MNRVFSAVGVVENRGGETFVRTRKSEKGCVVYGPYQDIGPGRYAVAFRIEAEGRVPAAEVCCVLDVAIDASVVVRQSVTAGELKAARGQIEVPFEVTKGGKGEYRVFATGASGLNVAYARAAAPVLDGAAPPRFVKVSQRAREQARAVFEAAYPDLSFLAEHGATFDVDERVIASLDGLRVHIDGPEDVQVLSEVFFMNEYSFACAQDCVVFDIGMNVGMASLAFAKMRNVRRVVAYEPFRAPFERARQNFALNAEIAGAIEALNIGLSNRNAKLDVLSDDHATIGTSIRGTSAGRVETIALLDASEALAPRISEAKADGLRVVLKVDCEGSEFSIFESLAKSGLFASIDAVVMEWHKWWSPNMTQADLVAPLSLAGFLVFDRTNRSNPLTGFLVAVRMAN